MSIKIEVHEVRDTGSCSLTGKEGEVLVVTFADGTITEGSLSQKSFVALLRMKLGGKAKAAVPAKPAAVPAATLAVPAGNGVK